MIARKIGMGSLKKIALVAHDNKKSDLVDWARYNEAILALHTIYATGTTGRILQEDVGLTFRQLQTGPLGGDQQIGAKIAEGDIDYDAYRSRSIPGV